MKKILGIFAHPDDEAFGPSGTLIKYAKEGVEIHLLFATKGEAGQNYLKSKTHKNVGQIREQEALDSARILGVKKVEFLGFRDGEIKQNDYFKLAGKIIAKLKSFQPQIVLTYDINGISGHLDHIAVSLAVTYSFLNARIGKKLYYFCLPDFMRKLESFDDYFIYVPPGHLKEHITTVIDISEVYETKIKALKKHKSQIEDLDKELKKRAKWPKKDYFILGKHRLKTFRFPEKELFDNI